MMNCIPLVLHLSQLGDQYRMGGDDKRKRGKKPKWFMDSIKEGSHNHGRIIPK